MLNNNHSLTKCTTTHPNDHSCEVSLQSDTKYILTFMVTMATVVILKMSNPKCSSIHHTDHSCEVSLQSDKKLFYISWLPWQQWSF